MFNFRIYQNLHVEWNQFLNKCFRLLLVEFKIRRDHFHRQNSNQKQVVGSCQMYQKVIHGTNIQLHTKNMQDISSMHDNRREHHNNLVKKSFFYILQQASIVTKDHSLPPKRFVGLSTIIEHPNIAHPQNIHTWFAIELHKVRAPLKFKE